MTSWSFERAEAYPEDKTSDQIQIILQQIKDVAIPKIQRNISFGSQAGILRQLRHGARSAAPQHRIKNQRINFILKVENLIMAGGENEPVRTNPPGQQVITIPTIQCIMAGVALEQVIPRPAGQKVGAVIALQTVITVTAV